MTLGSWITSLAVVSTLAVTGLAFAQQPTAQPSPAPTPVVRGTGVSMTNPATPDGKPITTFNQPVVDRWVGTSMTNPIGVDGKPLQTSTSFGQR
jgi:hypothetical protein